MPLLVMLSHFDMARRGYTPPRRVVPFGHGEEGIYLLVVFPFQFGRDKGHAPILYFLFDIL